MADHLCGATDPGLRGRLVVADQVVEHIATIAASEVSGVTDLGSTLEGLVGWRYPKADAKVAGSRARVHVEIAVRWPHPLGTVTTQVRDNVRARLTEMAGLQVDTVDVTASKVVHDDAPARRRVE